MNDLKFLFYKSTKQIHDFFCRESHDNFFVLRQLSFFRDTVSERQIRSFSCVKTRSRVPSAKRTPVKLTREKCAVQRWQHPARMSILQRPILVIFAIDPFAYMAPSKTLHVSGGLAKNILGHSRPLLCPFYTRRSDGSFGSLFFLHLHHGRDVRSFLLEFQTIHPIRCFDIFFTVVLLNTRFIIVIFNLHIYLIL